MTEINENIPTTKKDKYIAGDTALLKVDVTLEDSDGDSLIDTDIMFVLSAKSGGKPIIKKTLNNGIQITDADAGKFEIEINPEDTESIGKTDGYGYYYEISIEDSNGDIATVTTGTWTIYDDTAKLGSE